MLNPIYTIIYSSTAAKAFTDDDLERLLEAARKKNTRLGITGLLVFADATFFQVIEGDEGAVKKLYSQILVDSRHFNIRQLAGFVFNERRYDEWTMKYRKIETDAGGEL